MKIYSRKYFIFGLMMGVLALWRLWHSLGSGFDGSFFYVICWMMLSVRFLYIALNEDAYEKDKTESEKFRDASRRMFGRWAPVVTNIGWAVAIGALLLTLLNPALAGIAILLILAGVLYEIMIDQLVRKKM